MRNRVERLRIWLVGSAIFLIMVIAAFIGSARYLRHRILADLPGKLGINVESDANGWTYSQSRGSTTLYEIHAAKWERRKDGTMGLHDVCIVLHGQKGDRQDRIYGDEFEYDQSAGVVRAKGLVHMDMQGAQPAGGTLAGGKADRTAATCKPDPEPEGGSKVLHVITSDLMYLDKLGVAATSEHIEFAAGGMTGHATGADYTSDSGMLMLHSAVSISGAPSGKPVNVTAAAAEFDNRNQEAYLTQATYESEGRSAEAEHATLHRRVDGTLSRIEAQGNVTLNANGATVMAQRADVALTATSQPQTAVLTDGVRYSADRLLRQVKGQADAATISFDSEAKPQPEHAVFTGSVHMTERTRVTDRAREPWSVRDLTAAKLDTVLVAAGPGKSQLRDAEATGNPHLTMVESASLASSSLENSNGAGTTEVSADDLKAHLIAANDSRQPAQLDTIVGRGHTALRQISMDRIEQTSTGDTLDAKFRPRPAANPAKVRVVAVGGVRGKAAGVPASQQLASLLWNAVQQGHVTMMRRAPSRSHGGAKGGVNAGGPASASASNSAPDAASDQVEHAIAERAAYDGDLDRMTLTGGVQVMDAGSVLWANQVALDNGTGDSHAAGGVKMNYLQEASSAANERRGGSAPAAEPTHVLADRADLERATDIATFYGKPVRLWQGGNQVQAPVVEFSRAQKRLIARGEAGTGWSGAMQAAQVRTVLAGSGAAAPGTTGIDSAKAGAGAPWCDSAGRNSMDSAEVRAEHGASVESGMGAAGARSLSVVRVESGGLIYSEVLRQADFTGGFRAETVDGTVRARDGTVYLKPVAATDRGGNGVALSGAASGGPSLAGDLDRLVAKGRVALDQPGMHATGERLVYTASDRVGVLTGDERSEPKAIDAQGTTTGAALRFRSSCDGSGSGNVEVLGTSGQPVHTDARVSDEGKKEKVKR